MRKSILIASSSLILLSLALLARSSVFTQPRPTEVQAAPAEATSAAHSPERLPEPASPSDSKDPHLKPASFAAPLSRGDFAEPVGSGLQPAFEAVPISEMTPPEMTLEVSELVSEIEAPLGPQPPEAVPLETVPPETVSFDAEPPSEPLANPPSDSRPAFRFDPYGSDLPPFKSPVPESPTAETPTFEAPVSDSPVSDSPADASLASLADEVSEGARLIEPAEQHSALPDPDPEKQKYDEILALRARRGSVLEGTLLDGGSGEEESLEASFTRALKAAAAAPERIAARPDSSGSASEPRKPGSAQANDDATDECERRYLASLDREQTAGREANRLKPEFEPEFEMADGEARTGMQLRAWDRRLQTQANRLEQAGRYEDADRLRELATAIRLEARHWPASPSF